MPRNNVRQAGVINLHSASTSRPRRDAIENYEELVAHLQKSSDSDALEVRELLRPSNAELLLS